MIFNRPKFAAALTLTEVVVAMAILAIITLGGLSYQYHAARHSRIARAQIIGTRTAQLLLEDWKSTGGSEFYDPNSLELGFSSKLSSSMTACEGTALHSITVDNVPMEVTLYWIDRGEGCGEDPDYYDPETGTALRELSVTVRFVGAFEQADGSENILSVILTTYVRIDATGG